MVAGRSLPGWVVGISIFGTYLSSITFLALPGAAYGGNWNQFVFSLSLPLAALIATRYFVPLYRKRNQVSAYSYLEHRFGPWARTYATVFFLLTQLGRMGTIMFLVALALGPLIGWNVAYIIIVVGALVTLYTLLGGIEAVIWTDVVQSFILLAGALVAAAFILFGMPEGPGQLFSLGAASHKFSLGSFGASISEQTFWVVLIYGLCMNLQNFGIDQNYVQRYITAKSDREAKKSVWLSALLYIPASALFFFIGTGLYAFYTAQPGLLPSAITKGDDVFPHFIVAQLPVGVTGLVIAAIFAAAMSTLSTSVNSSATVILCDISKRYVRKEAGERESRRVLYVTTFFWGAFGTLVALAMTHVRQALDAWWTMASIFSGGMLGLFLLGFFSRRARNVPAAIGVVLGVLVIAWMSVPTLAKLDLLPPGLTAHLGPPSPFHKYLIIVIGTLTIFLVGFLISLLFGGRRRQTDAPAQA
jgi:SSS family solute:Na+ symporter